MDGVYRGKYGALGISGSASGAGGKAGVAGSLAVVVADGESSVTVLNGANLKAEKGDINLEATDKSKLSAAAMAAVLSKGTIVGVGAAFALLYAQNKVLVIVGDDVTVTAKSFTLNAEKQPVTIKDWSLPFEASDLFTVDAKTGEEGIINVATTGSGQDKFGVTMNVKAEDLVDIAQLTSFMGSVNYYASAAAGTIIGKSTSGGDSQLAMAGAVSMLFANSETKASIGNRARITLTSGDLDINAKSDNNARIIGGALSVSSAKAGVGLNVAVITNNDKVTASIGKDGEITVSNGDVNITAASDLDAWSITVAAAAKAGGTGSGATIGGGFTVIVSSNEVLAIIDDKSKIKEAGNVSVRADNDAYLLLLSASLAADVSGGSGVAGGGTVAVIVTGNKARPAGNW